MKLTIFGACALYRRIYIKLRRLSRKEIKMTCHQIMALVITIMKLTILGACAPYPRFYIKLRRLSRKEIKMTCHQNPGPGYKYHETN